MPPPLPRERWLADAVERFAALDTWRQEHPRATWTEIGAAVEAQQGRFCLHDPHGHAVRCPQRDHHIQEPS
jgi:hypothetical protein